MLFGHPSHLPPSTCVSPPYPDVPSVPEELLSHCPCSGSVMLTSHSLALGLSSLLFYLESKVLAFLYFSAL